MSGHVTIDRPSNDAARGTSLQSLGQRETASSAKFSFSPCPAFSSSESSRRPSRSPLALMKDRAAWKEEKKKPIDPFIWDIGTKAWIISIFPKGLTMTWREKMWMRRGRKSSAERRAASDTSTPYISDDSTSGGGGMGG
ncbi:hypothetical protein BLNAU_14010 [Blattamonas nauphoetae]|uniref:Uncharacterized protein n=1 Tax=Blattamonas nauphoetae TaxID=2049346 RepID=A0ABQ9XH78_9EUKA|nr:hypothetical protein BLNAU_14010 [Blattamonas nauphoetae]